jgi:hypothetical protein
MYSQQYGDSSSKSISTVWTVGSSGSRDHLTRGRSTRDPPGSTLTNPPPEPLTTNHEIGGGP